MYKSGWRVVSCPEYNGLPEFEHGARFSVDEMEHMLNEGWWPEGIVFAEPPHRHRTNKVVVNDGDTQRLVSVGRWKGE